jgi:hypothetical protein
MRWASALVSLGLCLPAAASRSAEPALPAAAPAPPAPVDDSQAAADYESAVNAFKFQEFDSAVPKLRGLLYPKTRLEPRRELRAREYLAAALWWTAHRDEALDEFTALLIKQPSLQLDPSVYPPKMIEDVGQRRKRLVDTGVLTAQAVAAPDPPLAAAAPTAQPPPLGLMFFPLGVGQFANRQNSKGWAFFIAETVLAGSSAGLYLYNAESGRTGPRPLRDDVIQVSVGAAFWLVAGWGIWDAYQQWRLDTTKTLPSTR